MRQLQRIYFQPEFYTAAIEELSLKREHPLHFENQPFRKLVSLASKIGCDGAGDSLYYVVSAEDGEERTGSGLNIQH